jgi:NADH-quinone oxidoreductase subunit G
VCPVGALTTRDFRFKARVWFLKSQKSVCSGCATGCNDFIDFDPRNQRVQRLRPRDNLEVNKFWMCDDGMMSYHRFNENRITAGLVRNGGERATSADEALRAAAGMLQAAGGKVAVVLSAQHSNEDNLAAVKLAAALGTDRLYLAALGGWEGDAILRHPDNNPNRKGAQLAAGRNLPGLNELLVAVASGQLNAVLALGWASAEDAAALAPLRGVATISLSSNAGALPGVASVVIPVATHAEAEGTFVNAKGMAQRFWAAVAPPTGVRPAWEVLAALATLAGKEAGFTSIAELRRAMPPGATGEARA